MKIFVVFLMCWQFSFAALAADKEPALAWLERLSTALQELNFSTSFVVVKNNQAEPYHWFHGVSDDAVALEILSIQNGLRRDILRKGNTVSYIEPELPPYSVFSDRISGPIPTIFSQNIAQLSTNYDFVSMGRSRILGRSAQLIRIVPKDNHRYGQWVWIDQTSGLLLKIATTSRQGQLLEQVQFTHLEISPEIAPPLEKLTSSTLPLVVDHYKNDVIDEFTWQVSWLPDGFTVMTANRHHINLTQQPTEFILFSDGLVDISVYASPSSERQRTQSYLLDGATVAFNKVVDGVEISVVGKIPAESAEKIADSFMVVKP